MSYFNVNNSTWVKTFPYGGQKYYQFCKFSTTRDYQNYKWGWLYPLPSGRFQFVEVPGIASEADFFEKTGPKEAIVIFANSNKLYLVDNSDATTTETANGYYYWNKDNQNTFEVNKTQGTPFLIACSIDGLFTLKAAWFTTLDNYVADMSDYDAASNTMGIKMYGQDDAHWTGPSSDFTIYFTDFGKQPCDGRLNECPSDQKCIFAKFEPNYCGTGGLKSIQNQAAKIPIYGWVLIGAFVALFVYWVAGPRSRKTELEYDI
jgi:hypothetical protein